MQDEVLWNRLGDSDGWTAWRIEFFEGLAKAAFEVQAIVENQVGLLEFCDVVASRAVEVRVDTFIHEGGDTGAVSGDVAHKVADHAGRANDVQAMARGGDPEDGC